MRMETWVHRHRKRDEESLKNLKIKIRKKENSQKLQNCDELCAMLWAMRWIQSCGIAPKRSVRFWRLTPTPGNTLTACETEAGKLQNWKQKARIKNTNKIMLHMLHMLCYIYCLIHYSKFSFESIEYEVKRTQKIGICTYITILCNMMQHVCTVADRCVYHLQAMTQFCVLIKHREK